MISKNAPLIESGVVAEGSEPMPKMSIPSGLTRERSAHTIPAAWLQAFSWPAEFVHYNAAEKNRDVRETQRG
jgi:hypothetical protein